MGRFPEWLVYYDENFSGFHIAEAKNEYHYGINHTDAEFHVKRYSIKADRL